MKTAFTEMLGISYPLVAFNRSPEVVVEASKAGALGVLAATAFSPAELDAQLTWIEERLGGVPYGVDLLVPEPKVIADRTQLVASLREQIPQAHIDFVNELMRKYNIPESAEKNELDESIGTEPSVVDELLDVCFSHRIGLIANALGTPPPEMLHRARHLGIPVAALVGKRAHAEKQLRLGVDILVAQGYEAGGHTGDIGTMVLTPDIIEVAGNTPVLTAGGIGTGRQLAAALALGAAGGWAGSVWLSTQEDIAMQSLKRKFLWATSSDTERNRTRTGKPARQLISAWHKEWSSEGAPAPLPMPLQTMLTREAWERIAAAAEAGHPGAQNLESYFIGQIVGSFKSIRSTRTVVQSIVEECDRRIRAISGLK